MESNVLMRCCFHATTTGFENNVPESKPLSSNHLHELIGCPSCNITLKTCSGRHSAAGTLSASLREPTGDGHRVSGSCGLWPRGGVGAGTPPRGAVRASVVVALRREAQVRLVVQAVLEAGPRPRFLAGRFAAGWVATNREINLSRVASIHGFLKSLP